MRHTFMLAILMLACTVVAADAQQSRVPPVETYKQMAEVNKATGWVVFSEYPGKQYVYFTPVLAMHCGLSEIRYSVNSPALDETFPLPECHPALPFSMPPDMKPEQLLLSLKPREAEKVAVQLVYSDGTVSEMVVFEPCVGVGEQACAFPVE